MSSLATRISDLITAIGADVKTIRTRRRSVSQIFGALIPSALASGTYLLFTQFINAAAFSSTNASAAAFYLDPADFKTGDKLRLEAWRIGNSVTPGTVTWTIGLYPVTFVRASAAIPTLSAGAVIAASQVAFANPGANGEQRSVSAAFTIPSAGWYALGVIQSAANAANATATVGAKLHAEST